MRRLSALGVAVVLAACAASGAPQASDGGSAGPTPESTLVDGRSPSTSPSTSPSPSASPTATSTSPDTPAPSTSPAATDTPAPAAELPDDRLRELGVNELGRVLVAQWHVIGDEDGEYRTSRATLRRQLEDLHDRGYRPVTQAEFLAGTFPIPAGTSPVLLTFDDSTRGHLWFDDEGEPAADSAVGIIEQFAVDRPGWRATAVFAFNFPEPFGDATAPAKLRWLVDHGYELSNHTVGHVDLSSMPADAVVANLAENQRQLVEQVPTATVPTLTLPFGLHAQDRAVERRGEDGGTAYAHDLVFLVGSDPTRSPHHEAFDPGAVQRVPAHAVVGTGPEWFGDWLDRLASTPMLRFVSDGDPTTVTYPADLADVAAIDGTHRTRSY